MNNRLHIKSTFQLRTHLLPIHFLDFYLDKISDLNDQIRDLLMSHPYIKESFLIASSDLYKQIEKMLLQEGNDKALISLLKYLLRMTSRSMPFGLFSGISVGEIKNFHNVKINSIPNHIKHIKASMDWVTLVARKIQQDQASFSKLYVMINREMTANDNEFVIPEHTSAVHKNPALKVLKRTPILNKICTITQKKISVKQIIDEIMMQTNYSAEIVTNYIIELANHHFLITNLQLPSTINDPLAYLIVQMEQSRIDGYIYNELMEIQQMFIEYSRSILGEGIEMYQKMIHKMNTLCSVKKPVIVDLYVDTIVASMDKEMIRRVEEIFPLFRISFLLGQRKRNWEYYKELFLDKYGMYNEIALLELLNPNTGLGPPPGYTNPSGNHHEPSFDSKEFIYNKYMLERIMKTVIEKKDEVEIDLNMIAELKHLLGIKESNLHAPIMGFDLKCNIYKDINDGDYKILLSTNSISTSPGMFWGRFSNLLERLNLQSALEFQRDVNGTSCAEINYRSEHYADLSLNNIQSEFEIAIGTQPMKEEESVIHADDLYVGMDEEGLYLKSKKHNQKIKPTASHLLYYPTFHPPNIVRFIYEYARYNDANLAPLYLGLNHTLPYIPRFRYKNIILSTAKWNIQKGELVTHSFSEWCSQFFEFKKKYHIPQYVELVEMDMNMLLNLNKEYCLLILFDAFKKLKNYETLLLSEAPYMFGDLIVNDELNNSYNSDFIITFENNDIRYNATKNYRDDIRRIDPSEYDFSNWIYVKLYGYPYKHKKLLMLLLDWVDENEIERFFFINYTDQRPHLRFRIRPAFMRNDIREKLDHLLANLRSENWITDYVYDNYEPEILRYGGPPLYSIIEQFFDADSRLIIQLMQHEHKFEPDQLKLLLALSTVIDFYPNYDEQMGFLHHLSTEKTFLQDFKKKRESYLSMGKEILSFTKQYGGDFSMFAQCYKHRKEFIEKINEVLRHLDFPETRELYVRRSILHMSMNRLLGIDRQQEKKIYELIKNINHNLRYQNKILQNEEHSMI